MKVRVVGKEFASGTSRKSGKDFAATIAHIVYPKARCEGQAVESVWLNPMDYPVDKIAVNKDYNLDRDSRGFVIGFDPL